MNVRDTMRRRWRWGVILAAAGLAGAVVAGQATAAPSSDRVPVFTATQLADGLLFKDGPALPYLQALQRHPIQWTDPLRQAEKSVDAAIMADPKWAASFAARIQSGDPNQVQTGLKDLSTLAQGVLDKLFGAKVVDQAVATVNKGIGDALADAQVKDSVAVLLKDADQVFAVYLDQGAGQDTAVWRDSDYVAAIQQTAVLIATETSFWYWTRTMPDDSAIYQEAVMLQELLVRTVAQSLYTSAAKVA